MSLDRDGIREDCKDFGVHFESYEKPLESFKQKSDMIDPSFLKDHSDCCIESRLLGEG